MEDAIRERFPNVTVIGNPEPPRMKAFEIKANGQLIHSKIETGKFPETETVLGLIADAASGKLMMDDIDEGVAGLVAAAGEEDRPGGLSRPTQAAIVVGLLGIAAYMWGE